MTPEQFDLNLGRELKTVGVTLASENNGNLAEAQAVALQLAVDHGRVTADDVYQRYVLDQGNSWLGNAAGSLFRSSLFEWTGELVASRRPSRHANYIRVWRLKPNGCREMKNVNRNTRAPREGREIICPKCPSEPRVDHFSWSAVTCTMCKAVVDKNDWVALDIGRN